MVTIIQYAGGVFGGHVTEFPIWEPIGVYTSPEEALSALKELFGEELQQELQQMGNTDRYVIAGNAFRVTTVQPGNIRIPEGLLTRMLEKRRIPDWEPILRKEGVPGRDAHELSQNVVNVDSQTARRLIRRLAALPTA